jgi:hypothetical protein
MSDRIQIAITATDGASRVFGQVASGADKMTASVSKSNASFDAIEANTRQTVAELQKLNAAMAQSSASTEKAASSASSFSKIGAAIGASLGVAVVAFGEFGRAAAESEASQARVETAVESTGAAFDEYAEAIQEASDAALELSFDDEEALDAISAITTATGDAAFAIENLGLVMDIARGRQIDLAAASKIVIAAEQGRYGSLARLGIQLDANATKEEALAALQGKYAGQAEAYAATSAGAYDRITESIENYMEAAGAHTQSLTLLALGAQSIAPAFALASTAVGAFGKALAGSKLAAVPGPLLAIAAAAGIAYIGFEALTQQGNVTSQGLEDLRENAKSVEEVLTGLAKAGDGVAMSLGVQTHSALSTMANDVEEMLRLTGEMATFQPGRATQDEQAAHEQNMKRLWELEQQYGDWTIGAEEVAAAESDLQAVLTNSGTGRELALQGLDRLNAEYAAGNISAETYVSGLENIADSLTAYDIMANQAADSTDNLTASVNRALGAANLAAMQERENASAQHETYDVMQARLAQEERAAMIAREGASAQHESLEAIRERQQATVDLTVALGELIDQFAGSTDAIAAMDGVFQSTVGNTSAWGQSSQAIADWATELGGAVEHFDEWGNSIGTWSRLDEVTAGYGSTLAAATISVEEATSAYAAFTDIAEENAEIQQNIAVIQAKQAPLIADQIELTENYTQAIAEMSAEQATVALGFMDSAQAGKALELQTLAISAASGELGEGGRGFASSIIVGAAEADGQLRAMLESMGLIEVASDGTITVNFEDNATGPMQQLINATEQLAYTQLLIEAEMDPTAANAAFEEIFGHAADWDETSVSATAEVDNSGAISSTQEAQSALDTFGNSTGTGTANVQDNASGTLSAIASQIFGLNGMTATTYVITEYISNYSSNMSAVGHGGVAGYAVGGVVAEMAEWGPELLHFPNGGVALARDRGLYSVPQGTYVDTAPATAYKLGGGVGVTININGPASWDDAAEQVSRKIVPAIQRAMREHERSLGAYS